MKKRVISLLLASVLVLSVLPCAIPVVFAEWSTAYTLTGNQALDIVSVAIAQRDKTKSELGYSTDWCSYFVYDCAQKAGISSATIPREGYASSLYRVMTQNGVEGHYFTDVTSQISNWTGGSGNGMTSNFDTQYSTGISSSTWTPQVGDIVFFTYTAYSTISHVAIVMKDFQADGTNKITVVHGNWSSKVTVGTTMPRGSLQKMGNNTYAICAYVRPNYNNNSNTGISTLSINPTTYPIGTHTQGKSFTLKGSVRSNYLITSFEGVIFNSAGGEQCRASMQPNKYSFNIENSDVDLGLKFGALPTGTYFLALFATDASGKSVDWSSDWFTVVDGSAHTHDKGTWVFYEAAHPHYNCYKCSVCGETWRDTSSSNYVESCFECNPPSPPGDSTLSINPTTAPSGTLTQGNSFSLQGSVTSNYPITYFEGYVVNSAYEIVLAASCAPNSYSVDIRSSNVNQSLSFGSLTTGSYYLVYNAVDSSGNSASYDSRNYVGWFTVAGGSTLPTMPTVTVPQSTFQAGQTVTIDWTAAAGNDSYWINVLRDGALIVDQAMGQTRTYYLQNAEIGSYTVYVSANNSAGTSGSSVCYFQVVEPNRILDINGVLNGQESGDINSFGTFDLYVNGSAYRTNCSDFCDYLPVGSTYEIKNITPYYGCSYDGIYSGNRAGTIGSENASVWLSFSTNDYSKITEMPSASYNSSNGHTYFYYATPVTWYFAEGFCASVGGHLVTLSDATENQFVKELVGGNFAWIGLSDAGSENAWHWITGESYAFSDWYPGQPDNYSVNSQGSEDYVHYNTTAWNDNEGTYLMGFVCEIEDPSLILNINGIIDGVMQEGLNDCGAADVYINGIRVAEGCSDYYMAWPKGTTYEIKNIRPAAGYSYDGIYNGSRAGTIGTHDPLVCFSFSENDFSRITETPTQSHFNGHTYLYYSSPVTWYFAKEYCESLGGHLITIISEQENQLAKQITDNNNVWLGASDAGSEGTGYWVTGEPFEYTNWLELQPDNTPNDSTGEENYAELNPTWTTQQGWNDVRGCVTHGFICELDYVSCVYGHSYVNALTEPTCTEQGYITHTCSVCGDSYTDSYVDALGHAFGAWTQTKAPTCTEKGEEKRTCSRCEAFETREIAALGHNYQAVLTAPTCTEGGYTTYTCSRCSDSYKDSFTDALGHSWDEGTVTLEPTETEPGVKTFTCTRCEETKTESMPAVGHTHSYTETIVAPTCTERGYTIHACACGDSYIDTYTAALGHAWDAGVVTIKPTETATGIMTYTCTRCEETKAETIPMLEPDPTPSLPCDGGENCPGNMFTDMPAKGNWAHDAIDWAIVNKITAGTSAATFSPNTGCTRAQVVTFLWRAAGEPEPTTNNNPFSDVKEGTYYYKAVLWAVEKKVTAGTSATTFSPDTTCTRAQIVTFLWRYEGEPAATTTANPFADVKAGAYYEKAVLWAAETGVTAGTSATTFSPDNTCTRAQVVTFLYRELAANQ